MTPSIETVNSTVTVPHQNITVQHNNRHPAIIVVGHFIPLCSDLSHWMGSINKYHSNQQTEHHKQVYHKDRILVLEP